MKIVLCHLKKEYARKLSEKEKIQLFQAYVVGLNFKITNLQKGENKFKTFVTSPEFTLSYIVWFIHHIHTLS